MTMMLTMKHPDYVNKKKNLKSDFNFSEVIDLDPSWAEA